MNSDYLVAGVLLALALLWGGLTFHSAADAPLVKPALQDRLTQLAAELAVPGCLLVERRSASIARYAVATDCIIVGAEAASYDDAQLRFVIAHEQAHRELGHAQEVQDAQLALASLYKRPLSQISDAEALMAPVRRALELAADAEASRRLRAKGVFDLAAIRRVLALQPETAMHPSGEARLKALAADGDGA